MVSIRAAFACVLIAGLTSTSASAEPVPVSPAEMASYENGFSAIQQETHTFQADLRQILHIQGVSRPIISVGTLYYASPGRLLIRFSQPAGEWMLVDGTQVAIQKKGQPLQRRDLSAPVAGKFPSHAASLLDFFHSRAERWHKDFEVHMTRDGNLLQVHLKPYLTPTAPDQGVDHIVTTLQLPAYDLTEIEISITAANRIEYQFVLPTRNPRFSPTLFEIPK